MSTTGSRAHQTLARERAKGRGWILAALGLGTLLLSPLVALVLAWRRPSEHWPHLAGTILGEALPNTLILALGAGAVAAVSATAAAVAVTLVAVPGRRFFEVALALPLAFPSNVFALTYVGLLEYAGPLAQGLRQLGWSLTDWPAVRTPWGAALCLGVSLSPYVYLLVRAALLRSAARTFEAARSLGASPGRALLRAVLPTARPAVLAGVLMVLLECLADYAVAAMFGVPTLSTTVYKAWFGLFSVDAAAQLASLVLLLALIPSLALLRAGGREERQRQAPSRVLAPLTPPRWLQLALATVLGLWVGLAVFVPAGTLVSWALLSHWDHGLASLATSLGQSLAVAVTAALATLLAAGVFALTWRLTQSPLVARMSLLLGLGYGTPGTLLAVAVFLTLSGMGLTTFGLVAIGLGLAVRFFAVGHGALRTGFGRIPLSLDEAARQLGVRGLRLGRLVHWPLLRLDVVTGAVLVMVDAFKEVPVTLMLRDPGFAPLALKVHELASEGEWQAAALPSLILVGIGLIPVAILLHTEILGKRHADPLSPSR